LINATIMQIIALENEISSLLGGQELNLVEICGSLAQRGHEINLVYTKEGNLLAQYTEFCNCLIKVSQYTPKRKRFWEMLRFMGSVVGDIRRIPVGPHSVIFCNDFSSVFFGYILSSIKGVPLIHYMQLPAYPFKFQWRPGLSAAGQFIAVSNQTKLSWVNVGITASKVNVVYNGIDTEKYSPSSSFLQERTKLGLTPNQTVILYVGRLNQNKGIEVLLRSMGLAVESGINAHLLVAGSVQLPQEDSPQARDKYWQYLRQIVADLNLEKHVSFLGHVTNTVNLYRASDITIVPSVWDEPFGRVIIESMACGTPVIASRIGGIPEVMMSFDWLFEPGNERELLSKITQLQNWRSQDPQLSQRCRQHIVDNFSCQKMIDGIETVLLKTLQLSS